MINSYDIQLTFDGDHQVGLKFGFLWREVSISWTQTKKLKVATAPAAEFKYGKHNITSLYRYGSGKALKIWLFVKVLKGSNMNLAGTKCKVSNNCNTQEVGVHLLEA